MRRIKPSVVTLMAVTLILGFQGCGRTLKVKLPQRGEPILYDQKQFPIEKWFLKSQGSDCWFQPMPEKNGWRLNADCEAEELQFLIVHHTATDNDKVPKTKEQRAAFEKYISDLEKTRLYEPVFNNPNYTTPYFHGLPIHSGHEIKGFGENFTAYHHYIYPNGDLRTTLIPYKKVEGKYYIDMLAWHAGKWKPYNTGGVAVALVGNYEKEPPPPKMLKTLKKLAEHYRTLAPLLEVKAHKEVRPRPTACPGEWWKDWIDQFNLTHPKQTVR